jgi:hypothetical protein
MSTLHRSWDFPHLPELQSFGFDESDFSDFINSIPGEIKHVMRRALDLHQFHRTQKKKVMLCIPGNRPRDFDFDDFNSEMWELDDVCGILQISFAPETGERRQVSLNSRYASIVSTGNREVVLNAHEQNECNLPYPHSDFLFLLVDDILHDFRDRVRFFRLLKWADPAMVREGVLVCCAVSREFDWYGQLSKVPDFLPFVHFNRSRERFPSFL